MKWRIAWAMAPSGSTLNLVTGLGTADPEFVGKNAVAAYNKMQILGMDTSTTASGVPVENTGGGGTADAHWRESVFTTELMTGYSNPGVPDPMSTVTVASMADLGYKVSYDHIQNNSYEFLVNVDDCPAASIRQRNRRPESFVGGDGCQRRLRHHLEQLRT